MISKKAKTSEVTIYIAGDIKLAKNVIQKYCTQVGLCVTVTKTDYVYSGGRESGMIIGLINYPRFATEEEIIFNKAKELGFLLLGELAQFSFTLQTQTETFYYSNKPEDIKNAK